MFQKKTLLLILSCLTALMAKSQVSTFDFTQGIIQDNAVFFDSEGYSIFIQELDYPIDSKGIKKLKRKFSIPKDSSLMPYPDFPDSYVVYSEQKQGEASVKSSHYFWEGDKGKTKVLGFSTVCSKDLGIENEFFLGVATKSMPNGIVVPSVVDTIDFAGRPIGLGPICIWRGVRNIQCDYYGQISWSEFRSLERAKEMIAGQMALNASKRIGNVLKDSVVQVIFEGAEVQAIKRKFKVKLPKLILGGSNVLVVYYVTAQVRGRYLACILSHYDDQMAEGELPKLLSEVMKIK